jgi:uncharacterized protein YndB with AHSA1/START domain
MDGKPKGYSICPTKSIKANARLCFDAFATAKALDAWFGPDNVVDLRDGGHWRNADGNRAVIKKVNANKNIRLLAEDDGLTWPAPVEIKFEAKGDKCTVMVSIERLQTRAEADGYRGPGVKRSIDSRPLSKHAEVVSVWVPVAPSVRSAAAASA